MEVKRFLIGSKAIFSGYKNFDDITTDTDILIIDDEPIDYDIETQYHDSNDDTIHYIRWKNMSKDELLFYHVHNVYMGTFIQKFLVPEYAEYLNLTIDELKSMERLLEFMDSKHEYEKVVFHAYVENNGFFLTPEQKEEAFQVYKKCRIKEN